MRKLTLALAVVGTWVGIGVPRAQAQAGTPTVPESAFFVGVGGGYGAACFVDQYAYAQGISNVFRGGGLIAVGSAAGSTGPDLDTVSRLVPQGQVGYFQHFTDSDWLWGVKSTYTYVGGTSKRADQLIPQAGGFSGVETSSFTGNVYVRSYDISVRDQFALAPFLGRSFDHCFLYVGAGPSLTRTETSLNDTIGFADINGTRTDITGAPTSFSSSGWMWGGVAVVGLNAF